MRKLLFVLVSLLGLLPAFAGKIAPPPDPFTLYDSAQTSLTYGSRQTAGLTAQTAAINPALKTLILVVTGQSLTANTNPTLYLPTNSTAVHQLCVYDGQIYNIGGPLCGSTFNPTLSGPGPGNVAVRIADTLVTNGKFDRVIIVSLSIGSTNAAQWGSGIHANRTIVAMGRLAARGITPSTTGTTWATIWDLGEDDLGLGTSQASFAASANAFISALQGTGFNGRIFVPLESGNGQTSNNVRSAQASLIGGNVFSGGDYDAIGNRVDGVHFNDTGAASQAAATVTAMHASGAPFLYLPSYAANDNWQALTGCNDNTADLCKVM